MYLWCNGDDLVFARDEVEASAILVEATGNDDEQSWRQIPDDEEVSWSPNDAQGDVLDGVTVPPGARVEVAAMAGDWCKARASGWLGSESVLFDK